VGAAAWAVAAEEEAVEVVWAAAAWAAAAAE
jgi:hypothetical protein